MNFDNNAMSTMMVRLMTLLTLLARFNLTSFLSPPPSPQLQQPILLEKLNKLQAELAVIKAENDSLRSSSALTTPLSAATPSSVVSRTPFHQASSSSSMAPPSNPPSTFSQRLLVEGFEMVEAAHSSSSSRKSAVPISTYEDEEVEEVVVGGKSKKDKSMSFVSATSSAAPYRHTVDTDSSDEDIAILAPTPMSHDSPVDRKKRNTGGTKTFRYTCFCGAEYTVGDNGDYRPLIKHRLKCRERVERPYNDDFHLKRYRQRPGGVDIRALVGTFVVKLVPQ